MRRAVVIGATGQIGRAAVGALARDGWEVTAASLGGGRDGTWPEEVRSARLDRADDAALAEVIGDGCDVLVDMVAYGAEHARQLTGLADRVGSAVVISSVSVYEDDKGRGFDTQSEPDGFPEYPVPIPESLRTVRPGDDTYSSRRPCWNANSSRQPTSCRRPCCARAPSTARTAAHPASCMSSSATSTAGAGGSSRSAARAASIRRASTTSPS